MLPFGDSRWSTLVSGFGVPYNPEPILRRMLQDGSSSVLWAILGEELCNQGELGSAEYAIVPWIVEYMSRSAHFDAKAAQVVVDIELWRPRNPPIPDFLQTGYEAAIHRLPRIILQKTDDQWDDLQVQMAAASLALGMKNTWFAEAYFNLTRQMIEHMMIATFGRKTWTGT